MSEFFYKSDCFNLYNTFYNGQCFRWEQIDNGVFEGIAGNRPLQLIQKPDGVLFLCDSSDMKFWQHYFDLDTDYKSIENIYLNDPVLSSCVQSGIGMHILRQDLWEVLISFIISQNNNISRIKKIIFNLSQACGETINSYSKQYYGFPSPNALASLSEAELIKLGLGYRASYIFECAQEISKNTNILNDFNNFNYYQAREKLLSIKGIGPKVANCILLFGLRHFAAFPVDTWIHKAMMSLYTDCGSNRNAIEKYAMDKYGDNAGLVQQYIFHAARCGVLKID